MESKADEEAGDGENTEIAINKENEIKIGAV